MNFDRTIKYIFRSNDILVVPPVLPMHRVPARDDVSAEVAHETVPHLDVRNRKDSMRRLWESIYGPRLLPVLQRVDDRSPIMLAVTVKVAPQMPSQSVSMNADLTFSTNRNLPSLVVANDFFLVKEEGKRERGAGVGAM